MTKQIDTVETRKQAKPEWLKAAKRPSYNGGNLNDASTAAAKMSLAYNAPIYVYAVHGGLKVTSEMPTLPNRSRFYRVNADSVLVTIDILTVNYL